MTTMTSLSTQSYKGTRDWYPEDKRVQNYIFETWATVCRRFGYEEYATPLLEPIEVYTAKTGQEIVGEQTYLFTDRGGRDVAIRPEMTPSVSRLVAARRQEMAYPARLFSIAQFMRYERPQRGREREFWQLNADIFGAENTHADAEIIELGVEIMKQLGATSDMYTIKINDRRVINAIMHEYLSLDAVQSELMVKLLDRRAKISAEQFRDQAIEIFGVDVAPAGLKKVSDLLMAKSIDDLPKIITDHESFANVREVISTLDTNGIKNLKFDATLMRGFDYYTGTVFEFFDHDPENNRSMFGGGRYDGLVGLFGTEPLSAVGIAPGLTTTELFLRSHSLLPEFLQTSTTEVYVVVLGSALEGATKLAAKLREEGVNTELDFTGRKLDKQIKTAVKKHIPFMIFVGEEELAKEQYNFKDVAKAEEQSLSFERIVATIKDQRRHSDDDFDSIA